VHYHRGRRFRQRPVRQRRALPQLRQAGLPLPLLRQPPIHRQRSLHHRGRQHRQLLQAPHRGPLHRLRQDQDPECPCASSLPASRARPRPNDPRQQVRAGRSQQGKVHHGPKDLRRDVRRERPKNKDRHFARAKGKGHTRAAPVARRRDSALAPRERRVREGRRDQADRRQDFRSDLAVEDPGLRRHQLGVSGPVQVFRKPNRASRFTHASRRRAAAVRQLKNDTLRASANCILCGLVRVRGRVQWPNQSRLSNASRGN
jgi:hypothetical protein